MVWIEIYSIETIVYSIELTERTTGSKIKGMDVYYWNIAIIYDKTKIAGLMYDINMHDYNINMVVLNACGWFNTWYKFWDIFGEHNNLVCTLIYYN